MKKIFILLSLTLMFNAFASGNYQYKCYEYDIKTNLKLDMYLVLTPDGPTVESDKDEYEYQTEYSLKLFQSQRHIKPLITAYGYLRTEDVMANFFSEDHGDVEFTFYLDEMDLSTLIIKNKTHKNYFICE